MEITIKTRDIGEITFFIAYSGGYVFADLNGQGGTLGQQICSGGWTRGNTLSATEDSLARVARRWNAQRRANARAEMRWA